MADKPRILFLCTGNSCRSQMAEGLLRDIAGERCEVYSAGIEKHGLNPLAVAAMREIGIDIARQESKTLDDLAGQSFDYVVTVCGHADETCPVFPGETTRIHKGFDDPPRLAANARSKEEALAHYARVRDEIKQYVQSLAGELVAGGGYSASMTLRTSPSFRR